MPRVNWIPCLTDEEQQKLKKLRAKKRQDSRDSRRANSESLPKIPNIPTKDSGQSHGICTICRTRLSFATKDGHHVLLNAHTGRPHRHQGG